MKKRITNINLRRIKRNWQLYVMLLIPVAYLIIFKYWPMYGLQIAFKDYNPTLGFTASPVVGLKHFIRFFSSAQSYILIKNTIVLSTYTILLSLPVPILLAICMRYCISTGLSKTVQMVTYFPHFLSVVVLVSLINLFFNYRSGVISNIINGLLNTNINFLQDPKYFKHLYVWSGVWQNMGWNSILYYAALMGVDNELHEASTVDGASKWRMVWNIDLPSIMPTIAVTLIMNVGTIFTVGFDKTFLMQNVSNINVSEVLSTYEYKIGIGGTIPSYSYPAAIGFVTSVVTFLIIIITNKITKRITESGLW